MERISHIPSHYEPAETALIILGDAGINFYLNKTDKKNKKIINNTGYIIYCVRGNHEERPENIETMENGMIMKLMELFGESRNILISAI